MQIDYYDTETTSKFHSDNSFVRVLMGPVGCGKTSGCSVDLFKRAYEQEAGHDGIRRSRWGIIRNTYPELKSTTIKTWLDWFPQEVFGPIKWDSPITHRIYLDGMDIEVIFLALDSEQDIKKLMSFEFTGIYINELQFVHPKIFQICQQRVNRYPSQKSGANITWAGVIADTNPPSTRHWIYELFEKNKPPNFNIYKFEPAVKKVSEVPNNIPFAISRDGTIYINNEHADYLNNLPNKNYYLNQIPGMMDEEIKVYMLGEYGVIITGKPVHPEYSDRFHFANKELKPLPDVEIGLGWDFGLTPACGIVQVTPRGQLTVLYELYTEKMGLRDFAENIVIPHLNTHVSNWRNRYVSRHDPAGQAGSQTDGKNCQQILEELHIESYAAAPDNSPTPRREGLNYHLRRFVDGEPGFILSNQCPIIREGLMGHFQYASIKSGDIATRYHEKPLKNLHSHICEGLEYIAMHYALPQNEKRPPAEEFIKNLVQQHKKLQQARLNQW